MNALELQRPRFARLLTVQLRLSMPSFRTSSFFLLSAAVASAQTTTPHSEDRSPNHPVHLEPFMVTASPYGRHQADVAQPTSVLAGRELLLNQSSSLGELLSGQPGVSSTYFGPGASRPIIRGLSGDRLRMLTDGVGTMDASVLSPDHAVALDPLLVERVEVVRGPATLLYGGSAVGGVVNVIDHRIHTTRPPDAFNARFEVRNSSVNDETSGGAVLEGGAGVLAWHLDGYRRRAGNVQIPGFAESALRRAAELEEAAEHGEPAPEEVAGHIPNSAVTASGAAGGFSFVGANGFLGFAYSGHNTLYGVPAGAHEHHDEDTGGVSAEEEGVRIDLRQRRLDLRGAWTQPFGIFREARFKLGSVNYQHEELEGEEIGTQFLNDGFDGRLEFLHGPVGAFTGAVGLQGSRSDFEAIGEEAFVPPSLTENQALFVFEEATWKPLTWQVGARVERQSIDLQDQSGRSRRETNVSASTGLVATLSENWTLGASLAHAERAPNAQELFANGPHIGTNAFEIGSPTLKPEKALALDLTLRKRTGFVTGSLTTFVNQFDGYIFEQPTGELAVETDDGFAFVRPEAFDSAEGLPVYQFVQRDAEFYGAELETTFHVHHTDRQQLDLTLSADVVRAREDSSDAPLPRITPARLKAGVAWTNGDWALGGDVQFVDDQRHVASYETTTDGYVLTSAYATYRLTFDQAVFDVFVRGSNLGHAEARMHTSFLKDVAPLPGRSITVGLRAAF